MTTDTEKRHREDNEFAARVGKRLRGSVDELDAATLSRLNRARQAALENIGHRAAGANRRTRWLTVGAAAAVAAIVVGLWQVQTLAPDVSVTPVIADEVIDIELLLDEGDLEMYEELEFFAWLPEDALENIG